MPPPVTGATVRNPDAFPVPDTMVMTGQDRLNRPRGRPESPTHRVRRPESPQAETASGTILVQAQAPWVSSLFPWPRPAGVMFIWYRIRAVRVPGRRPRPPLARW